MDDLIADFLTETKESLEDLDNKIINLEQNPNDKPLLDDIFRLMHTIKGTCGFLSLSRLEAVAHSGENILDKMRSEEIKPTQELVALVIEAIDKIKEIVAYIEQNSSEPSGNDNELIEKLNNVASGESDILDKTDQNKHPEIEQLDVSAHENHQGDDNNGQKSDEADNDGSDGQPEQVNNLTETKQENIEADVQPVTDVPLQENVGTAIRTEVQQTIRVNVDVLENLMQIVGELVLNRNQLIQLNRSTNDSKFSASIQHLSHITSELQEGVMKTRMQPIKTAWTKLPRIIRDLAKDLGKKIDLKMIGEETELDRQLIESIKDPLTHMIRNSADHGLETPEERVKSGKREIGTITVSAYHQGGHIVIQISDDGKGIDVNRVKNKIIESNLASEEQVSGLSDQQIIQYIFKPGFSTAQEITSVSGRGVGMDVVRTNIEKISGTIELNSTPGKGSDFIIKIPLTLAIMPILIVECCNNKFGIPQINVIEMCRTGKNTGYVVENINNKKIMRLRDTLLPLITLSDILSIQQDTSVDSSKQLDMSNNESCTTNNIGDRSQDNDIEDNKISLSIERTIGRVEFVVVCEVNNYSFGLIVDKIFDSEEIVVKPVTNILKKVGLYSGNTILGNGEVIMILDPVGLTRSLGDINTLTDAQDNHDNHKKSFHEQNLSSFLVMQASDDTEHVIPLELVTRLEEIDVKKIEKTNSGKAVQYRSGLMYLAELGKNFVYPESGSVDIIVFNQENKTIGLVVKHIVDIVEHDLNDNAVLEDSNFRSIVVDNKTRNIIDIRVYFDKIFGTKSEKGSEIKQLLDKKCVLFVDDSSFFRKFIPPSIEKFGYVVTSVADASKAIDLLEQGHKYDAVITDINMPGLSGYEFAEYCRKNNLIVDEPIIALTSNSEETINQSKVRQCGISSYVSKTNYTNILNILSSFFQ